MVPGRAAAAAALAAVVVVVSSSVAPASAADEVPPPSAGRRPQLLVAMFSNVWDQRLALPFATAFQHGLRPVVLGLGRRVEWGAGLGNAWNAYREYALKQQNPDDLMLFVDAYDVMFQGGEEELVSAYLALEARTGRQLFYNADPVCSSPRVAEYPATDSPWKYLNSGVYMGRVAALQRLFAEKQPPNLRDRLQNLHTDFFLDHQDVVGLDYNCEFAQVVWVLPGLSTDEQMSKLPPGLAPATLSMEISQGVVRNRHTNTTPVVLHFPGPGHWPLVEHGTRPGTCLAYELLREVSPEMLGIMEQSGYGLKPWKPMCSRYKSHYDVVAFRLQDLGDLAYRSHLHGLEYVVLSLTFLGLVVRPAVRRCRGQAPSTVETGKSA